MHTRLHRRVRCPAALACLAVFLSISTSFAQSLEQGPPVPLAVGSSAGVRAFRSERWGVVGIEIANTRDYPATVHARFFFDDAQQLQFGRMMWIPPHSRRIVHCPVVPPKDSRYEKSFEIRNVLYEIEANGNRILLKDLGQAMQRSMLLLKTPERLVSAVFPPMPYEQVPSTSLPTAYDSLVAIRVASGLTRRVGDLALPNFPDQMHYLDVVDQLVIHNESPFTDAATVATIRQWVQRGGRLWVMLDQVPMEKVATMFGDSFHCSLVDRVELNDFTMVSVVPTDPADEVSLERPVSMVRVDVEDMDVRYTVDGWPAAFVQTIGLGRVLYTTISPPAWLRKSSSNESNDPERQSDWLPRKPLLDLASLMLDAPPRDRPRDKGLNTYVAQRVGYKIVPRRPVLTILGIYVAALGGCGLVLMRKRASGNLVWLAPLLIIGAATPIAVVAAAVKQQVPRTAASVQIVQISPGTQEAHVHGSMALFLQAPETAEISGLGSEAFMTDNWGGEETTRELLWTDYDHWTWKELRLTGGMKMAELNKPVRLQQPMRARVTFGPNGLEGDIEGHWAPLEDAQVHVSSRRGLALHVENGHFSAGPGDLLAKGQFITGTFLNDEQRRRQILLRDLTQQQPERLYSPEPTLLFWTQPLELKVTVPEGFVKTGTALVRLPLQIKRPPPNSPFVIPSTFLPFRTVSGPTGKGAASTYIPGVGEWVPMSSSSETWLRVQFPKQVLPLQLQKLRIALDISAPSRLVQIVGVQDGKTTVLHESDSPSGSMTTDVEQASVLELDNDGGILIGINVGPVREADHQPEWRIHDLQFTAHARRP